MGAMRLIIACHFFDKNNPTESSIQMQLIWCIAVVHQERTKNLMCTALAH